MKWQNRELINVKMGDVDHADYPKYCDAYVESATYEDTSRKLTQSELDKVNEDQDLVYKLLHEYLY